jgi:hypothetical protein
MGETCELEATCSGSLDVGWEEPKSCIVKMPAVRAKTLINMSSMTQLKAKQMPRRADRRESEATERR